MLLTQDIVDLCSDDSSVELKEASQVQQIDLTLSDDACGQSNPNSNNVANQPEVTDKQEETASSTDRPGTSNDHQENSIERFKSNNLNDEQKSKTSRQLRTKTCTNENSSNQIKQESNTEILKCSNSDNDQFYDAEENSSFSNSLSSISADECLNTIHQNIQTPLIPKNELHSNGTNNCTEKSIEESDHLNENEHSDSSNDSESLDKSKSDCNNNSRPELRLRVSSSIENQATKRKTQLSKEADKKKRKIEEALYVLEELTCSKDNFVWYRNIEKFKTSLDIPYLDLISLDFLEKWNDFFANTFDGCVSKLERLEMLKVFAKSLSSSHLEIFQLWMLYFVEFGFFSTEEIFSICIES